MSAQRSATQGEDFTLLFLNLFLNIFRKNQLEDSSHKRLNKKQLGKKGKREIKTHESQPLNQSDMNLESIVVRIVKEGCNQTHCRYHQAFSKSMIFRLSLMCSTFLLPGFILIGKLIDIFILVRLPSLASSFQPCTRHKT